MTALPKRIKDATGKTPEAMDLNFNLNPARSLPWGREAEKTLLASFGRRRQGSQLAFDLQKMRNGLFAWHAFLLPYPVSRQQIGLPRKINGNSKVVLVGLKDGGDAIR